MAEFLLWFLSHIAAGLFFATPAIIALVFLCPFNNRRN